MIITQAKQFQELLSNLQGYTNIFLIGCGECSTTCKTGGEQEVRAMKDALVAQGKTVIGTCLPKAPCVTSQVKTELAKQTVILRRADALVVMACGLGVQAVQESDRQGHVVIPALDTLCGAVVNAAGDFEERCSLCGACVLGETAARCPLTLCAKGLLNGPCGGMHKGACEVDRDRDCVWVLIYKDLARRGKLSDMKKTHSPRDWRVSARPHKITVSR